MQYKLNSLYIIAILIILLLTPLSAQLTKNKTTKSDGYEKHRNSMVSTIKSYGFKNQKILDVMNQIPRHLFVPKAEIWQAYSDRPVPIGHGQTISQPYIVAYMTEKAGITGKRALEVGTGSGYQAAVLSKFFEEVYSIEIVKELAEQSSKRLKDMDYKNIQVKQGDGYDGWKEYAPFDVIIVTAAAEHIPPPLIQQLNREGKMIIPVGNVFQVQTLVLITKDKQDKTRTENLIPVRFVPFIHKPVS